MAQPGMTAATDPKTELNHFCQRYCQRPVTKADISYTTNKFGNQYQSIVKLDCIQGQEYAGHLCLNQKEAEKSAAEQAVMAFRPQMASLPPPASKDPKKKKERPRLTPAELAAKKAKQAEEGENPAVTPKTKLNALVMKIAKRYLQKGETIYETKTYAGGGHQATVQLKALPGEWGNRVWAGHVSSTKQKAEQSAAEIALKQISEDSEMVAEAAKPKGVGKGKGKGKGKGFGLLWGWDWNMMWGGGSGPNLPREKVSETPMTGEVVEWKENFGWVKPAGEVDHPSAKQREGKLYVSKKDVTSGNMAVGCKVSFMVYKDPQGLGAEEVQVGRLVTQRLCSMGRFQVHGVMDPRRVLCTKDRLRMDLELLEKAQDLENLSLFEADTRDAAALLEPLSSAAAVVCTTGVPAFGISGQWEKGNHPETVDHFGVKNVAHVWSSAEKVPKRRFVLMSSIGVTRRDGFPYNILNGGGVLDAKARGEEAVAQMASAEGFGVTVVRPGQLFGGPYENNRYLGTLFQLDKDINTRGVSVQPGDTAVGDTLRSSLAGVLVRCLFSSQPQLEFSAGSEGSLLPGSSNGHRAALEVKLRILSRLEFNSLAAVGHRVVHGETFTRATLVNEEVLERIERAGRLAPMHNPWNLLGIQVAQETLKCPQVAVFDTAFHQTMPPEAYMYALPHELCEKHGLRKYGFHGTSYLYIVSKAAKALQKPVKEVNLIVCHLGSGASMCAIQAGQCIDTTMGFTPLEGLVMGTRCGDLDPAVPLHLIELGYSTEEVSELLNKHSGLKGLCGFSDNRDVEARFRTGEHRAQLAKRIQVYRTRKHLGSYLVALNRVDALIFTGGVGENSPLHRSLVCEGLERLGIQLDEEANQAAEGRCTGGTALHKPASKTEIWVIPTDEELSIAQQTADLLAGNVE
ncbi:Acetate kinase (Acetokinase) [Durusdinium trenchii]|uniref:Probable acetate kinase n=1 Tax=Durusdinium trenchii TaxID=1381693 RepID=A0ABP0RXK5_9DINO